VLADKLATNCKGGWGVLRDPFRDENTYERGLRFRKVEAAPL